MRNLLFMFLGIFWLSAQGKADCTLCPDGYTAHGSITSLGMSPYDVEWTGGNASANCSLAVNKVRSAAQAMAKAACETGDVAFITPGTLSPGTSGGYMGLNCGCFSGGAYCWVTLNSVNYVCCTPNSARSFIETEESP